KTPRKVPAARKSNSAPVSEAPCAPSSGCSACSRGQDPGHHGSYALEQAEPSGSHTIGRMRSPAVLLVQLGTPDAPTTPPLRRYLRQFLGDPRVIEAPRWLWWLILNLRILPTRPQQSAAKYRRIWHPQT